MKIIELIDNYIKKQYNRFKKWFNRQTLIYKFAFIFLTIIFFDLLFTELLQLKYLYNYYQEQKVYELYIDNVKKINAKKNRQKKEIRDSIVQYIRKNINYNFNILLEKFHKDIEKVEFLVTRDTRDFITFITPTLYLKDKSIIKVQKFPLVTDIALQKYIKQLEKYKIPYQFVNRLSYVTNRGHNYIMEPRLKIAKPIVTTWLYKNFLLVTILFVLLYMVIQQTGLGSNSNKFEVLDPNDIEGDLDNLIGMKDIKEEILQLKDILENISKYKSFGIDSTFNIMFSGPAGTGKTKIASYLAKELKIPMIIGTGNVETGYVAGGANTIRNLFNQGYKIASNNKKKSVIIFLDEAQVLLQKRGQGRNKWEDDSANELLAQLDGVRTIHDVNIIFIAASNFNEQNFQIDEAMERRFKKKIFFRLPTKEERKDILEFYLNKIDKSNLGDINIDYIANITSGHSPAKLETLIQEASLYAIRYNRKIDTDILFKAFERINVGITTRDVTKKQDKTRKIIILHELGHFVTEFDYYYNKYQGDLNKIEDSITTLKISSEAISNFDNALGYVLHNDSDTLLKTKKEYEEDIIRLYGGHAAEQYFFNNSIEDNSNVTTGAYNDIQKITNILNYLVVEIGMYSDLKINLNQLDIKNNDKIIETLESISNRLFKESFKRIEQNRDLIEFLYEKLYNEWTLTKDQLFVYIKEFYDKKPN